MILTLLLVPALALADRLIGKGGDKLIGPLGGRSLGLICAALGMGVAYLVSGGPLAIAVLVWAANRTLPWAIGGTTTPRGAQIPAAFLRHAVPALVPIVLWVNHVPGGDWRTLLLAFLAYALAATVMAVAYAKRVDDLISNGRTDDGSFNAMVESARGALCGAALTAWVML